MSCRTIAGENLKRNKPWSTEAVDNGFHGAKYNFVEGVTPVMSFKDTKVFLASIMLMLGK